MLKIIFAKFVFLETYTLKTTKDKKFLRMIVPKADTLPYSTRNSKVATLYEFYMQFKYISITCKIKVFII